MENEMANVKVMHLGFDLEPETVLMTGGRLVLP